MGTQTQVPPDYYVWAVPGKPAVHLRLSVLQRIEAEILRGFGAVPKRGAEAGGLLLGTIEPGDTTIVRIEDLEAVPCSYKHGPSYLFSEQDAAAFAEARERWKPDESRPNYAVGFFRGHTRDGLGLGPEDVDLMERYFPAPDHVALLVKPFATRASIGGFFFREDGVFPGKSPLEFPFRRWDLTGEQPPPRRSLLEGRHPRREHPDPAHGASESAGAATRSGFGKRQVRTEATTRATSGPLSRSWFQSGWVWMPLSFIFLVLGVVLGFQTALTMGRPTFAGSSDLLLALTVIPSDNNLNVRWNRDAPAVRAAQRGLLEIDDGGFSKPVELDRAHLQNGSVIYRHTGDTVRFRLTVYVNPRVSVSETLEWRQ
jgi:hypothetical protein